MSEIKECAICGCKSFHRFEEFIHCDNCDAAIYAEELK